MENPEWRTLSVFAARWRVLLVTWNACTREPARAERLLRDALAFAA
jgi:hypothetical protein